jgi:mono/diheme cytochrome c family protein
MSIEVKATILGLAASLCVLGVTFGVSPLLQAGKATGLKEDLSKDRFPTTVHAGRPVFGGPLQAEQGHKLFDHNCASCHGDDARGDEGPNLYDLTKSDARITKIIKEGVKGEMPKFGKKLNDADIEAIIAYPRTLKS